MKAKKTISLVLCAILLMVASVAGTLAYLTDEDEVANTFTVGSVDIELWETKVDENGAPVPSADPVKENKYHLLPGLTYVKDPTVTVIKGSEPCYVRMLVQVEGLDSLKAAMPADKFPTFYQGDLFLLQNLTMDKNGEGAVMTWDKDCWSVAGFDPATSTYEFRYKEIVDASDATENVVLDPLFEAITVPGAVTNTQLDNLKNVKINVTAHAIQAASFADVDEAWNNF